MRTLSRADLMSMGRDHADDPDVFLVMRKKPDGSPHLQAQTHKLLPDGTPEAWVYIEAWAAEWARLAFPIIEPSHIYAAALMAAVPPPDQKVRAPWPVFYLTVPGELVTIVGVQGPEPVRGMLVFAAEERWTWLATAGLVELSRLNYSLDEMRELHSSADELPAWKDQNLPLEVEHDQRAALCLSRLVINTCVAMSDPGAARAVGKAHQWKPGMRPPETPRIFQLSRLVPFDCRPNIREYVAGTSELSPVEWPLPDSSRA